MDNLKAAIKSLEKETGRKKQIELLQNINHLLLNRYTIKVGNFIIEPLLLEAYYYYPGKFQDTNTHGFKNAVSREKQSDNFGKLYVHKIGYGGIDVCLSLKDKYCLSVLIKNSLVSKIGAEGKKEFCTQVSLLRYLKENFGEADIIEQKGVLLEGNEKQSPIVNTVRKGVKGVFKEEKLASLFLYGLKNYPLTLENGYGKEKIVEEYLKENYNDASKEKWEEMSKEVLGYHLKKVTEKRFSKEK